MDLLFRPGIMQLVEQKASREEIIQSVERALGGLPLIKRRRARAIVESIIGTEERELIAQLTHRLYKNWVRETMGFLEGSEINPHLSEQWKPILNPYEDLTEEQRLPFREFADQVLAIRKGVNLPSRKKVEEVS